MRFLRSTPALLSIKRLFRLKNRSILPIISLVLCLGLWLNLHPAVALAGQPKHYTDLTFPKLPELKLPKYTRFQLKNGLIVYLMEDHELPLVSGTALVKTGSRWEPSEKVGLATLTGAVMRSGGTKKNPADRLNQLLENQAAAVETSISLAAGSASFSCLTSSLNNVFNLFAEVMKEPAFPLDQFELAKQQIQGSIARRNDDPNSIVSREFSKLIYGAQSPYARVVEYTNLANIQLDDLVAFYQNYFQPQNVILGIVGDFNSNQMRQAIEQQFNEWPLVQSYQPNLPEVKPAQVGGIFTIDQPQLTQSYVQIGHLGGMLNSPDYMRLGVMNEVLNGFGGRLFNEVRSRQGLAYTVYASWSPRYDYPGLFIAGGQTKSETTGKFIKSIRSEIEKIRNETITPEELKYAKETTLNSFIFNFEDPSQTLSRLMRYEYYNYPKDFIFRYRQGVEDTTITDVQKVASQYLQPDNLVTLVVGNMKAIDLSDVTNNQQVKAIDISIPKSN